LKGEFVILRKKRSSAASLRDAIASLRTAVISKCWKEVFWFHLSFVSKTSTTKQIGVEYFEEANTKAPVVFNF
jgi:hypothetical protein